MLDVILKCMPPQKTTNELVKSQRETKNKNQTDATVIFMFIYLFAALQGQWFFVCGSSTRSDGRSTLDKLEQRPLLLL